MNADKPVRLTCMMALMRVGVPLEADDLYFEQQKSGSHGFQVHAINNVYGKYFLTTKMLHAFIRRRKALEVLKLATAWKATYIE
jgi:hypothetical protein